MSEMQDLIARTSHLAYETGIRTERERVIRVLEANFIDNELLRLAVALISDDHAHV
jgi:hypothetical protein